MLPDQIVLELGDRTFRHNNSAIHDVKTVVAGPADENVVAVATNQRVVA